MFDSTVLQRYATIIKRIFVQAETKSPGYQPANNWLKLFLAAHCQNMF